MSKIKNTDFRKVCKFVNANRDNLFLWKGEKDFFTATRSTIEQSAAKWLLDNEALYGYLVPAMQKAKGTWTAVVIYLHFYEIESVIKPRMQIIHTNTTRFNDALNGVIEASDILEQDEKNILFSCLAMVPSKVTLEDMQSDIMEMLVGDNLLEVTEKTYKRMAAIRKNQEIFQGIKTREALIEGQLGEEHHVHTEHCKH